VRQLRAEPRPELRPLRVAIATSWRGDPIGNYLIVEAARRGFLLDLWFAPYGQWEIQCFTPGSDLYAQKPDVVILAADDPQRVIAAAHQIRGCPVIVFNSLDAPHPAGVIVFDFARILLEHGLRHAYDRRLDYVSRTPFTTEFQIAIAGGLARLIRAIYTPPAKCLVVDLDETLWGGILGEAGIGGIALGHDYPGRVYRDFQQALRNLRDRGILLAIASKNNEADIREVFANHPDMLLRWDDFAATQIHWGDKATSLRRIADDLRIGLDSIVFYDDNPIEREWVRAELPEVTVLDVPGDPMERLEALEAWEAFDQVALSDEDGARATLYTHDRRREEVRRQSESLEEFLATLDIRTITGIVDDTTLPRVAQLFQRTNQFNLTGRRYTEAELQRLIDAGAIACWLRASDRFGDYGLVGAAIAAAEDPCTWRVDNLVMSCRILGRNVEQTLIADLEQRVTARGARCLIGEYIPTPKNVPARDFYSAAGFRSENGRWIWCPQ